MPKEYKCIVYEKTPDGKGGFNLRPVTSTSLLSPNQAASILGIGKSTVHRICDLELLPCERPSPGRITISLEDLMAYKAQTRDPEFFERQMKKRPREARGQHSASRKDALK